MAAHPTGYVPERARVRFRAYPPGVWAEDSVEFAVGERWVIIATRKDGGRYQHDGGCGQTQRVPRHRYAELIASSVDLHAPAQTAASRAARSSAPARSISRFSGDRRIACVRWRSAAATRP